MTGGIDICRHVFELFTVNRPIKTLNLRSNGSCELCNFMNAKNLNQCCPTLFSTNIYTCVKICGS